MTSLVSRENRAIPSGKGREKMQSRRPTLSEMSENTMHHTPQQPGCFTPKRQLPRTPPRSCRSPLASSRGSENEAGRTGNVQDVCFTPTHALRRSPVSKRETAKLRTASTASSALTRSKQTKSSKLQTITRKSRERPQKAPTGPATKLQHHTTDDRSKKTQAACFTPSKTLARSPPNKRRALGQDQESSVVDDVPPPTRWEIPRTPVQRPSATGTHQSSRMLQDDAADSSQAGGFEESEGRLDEDPEVKRGPVSFPDPPLLRQFGNETIDRSANVTTTVMGSGQLENESSSTVVADDRDTIPTEVSSPKAIATSSSGSVHHTSPPIGAGRETEFSARLPGLVCTENDLAYLQHVKNVKQYEQLQARVTQLDKDLKATAQRKEQLDHETLKISQDLVDMRTKYCGTVSALHDLISTPSAGASAEVKPSSDEGPVSTGPIPELTRGNIARLKRVHNLTAAQFEKTGKELTSKLSDIELQKQQLEKQLKEEETKGEAQKQKLHSQLHSAKEQRSEWEMKVQEAAKERAAIEAKLTELQSRVSCLKLSTASSDSGDSCGDQEAKRRAEERLKRVIRRCELYVQRHQMLREMGIKGRRGN